MIEKASVSLDDSDALEAVELFPVWQVGVDYSAGARVRDGEELFKCIQPHTSQADWRPSITPALWQKVEKPGQGDTPDNPIPWSWGLKIFNGKYYSQNDVIYRGIRDSGVGIFADLSALVGNYVEVYNNGR
jgi:hypothetical protein